MVANYLTSTIFMFVVLLILFVKISNDMKEEKIKRMYQILDIVVALYVLLDACFAVSFLMGQNRTLLFKVIVFLFFVIYVITPFVWQMFVHSYIDISHGKLFQMLEKIPLAVLLLMILISIPTGYVWQISGTGEYIRGKGFRLFTAINLFYYLEAFGNSIYILNRKRYRKEPYLLQYLFLSALPLAAILVNTYLIPLQMTYPFQPFCLVLGALFAYLFMVDRQKNMLESMHSASLNQALEMEKEAVKRAVEAGKVKSLFLANMSHDIRTPINAILGFADIIDRHPDDEAQVRYSVGKIKNSGRILLNMINDVLDLTRIENDRLQLNESFTDLSKVTEEIQEVFGPAMSQQKLIFEIKQEISDPFVICDEGKLQRILTNVINNAVKFTPEDGRIELSVTEYPGEGDRGIYEFLVRDTGIGISKEFQNHVFEAFEQEQSSTVSNTSGVGLGLSIVKKLVERMNGTIEIESSPGKGTAVKIMIPFTRAHMEPDRSTAEKSPASTDLSGVRILLVEDNELNREIALAVLEEKGADVTLAVNGKEALESFECSAPGYYDIILMDVMMPVMDGLEAARRIRALKRRDALSVPIFAVTANAFQEDIEKSREAGCTEHLSKPLDYELLARKIRGTRSGERKV